MLRRLPKLKFPEPVEASPEDVDRVILHTPPPSRWKYMDLRAKQF